MGKASFGQLTAYLLPPLASLTSHAPPVLVRALLLDRFAIPMARAAIRFRDIGPHAFRVEILPHCTAVIALVGHHLWHSVFADCAPG
jgi:hypothetical protein